MARVIDIRGTHGSGKSWVVHQLLGSHNYMAIVEPGSDKHLGYWVPDFNMAVLGSYSNKCGGCDGIKTADEVVRRVRLFQNGSKYDWIMLEGILVAHTFKRYAALADEIGKDRYTFCFLNTPLAKCIARVKARRLERGAKKPFNPKHLKADYHNIWENIRFKFKNAGYRTIVLPYQDPLTPILEELKRHAH